VTAILTRRARRELAAAVRSIARDNPDTADRLRETVMAVARLIGSNPALGTHRPGLAGPRYRFWSIPRYRYLLVYTDATEPPRIVRVVHTPRDLPSVLSELLP